MGRQDLAGLTLDSGALVAFEKRDRRVNALLQRALDHDRSILIPAGVLGQVWRGGGRQARLAMLLSGRTVAIEELTAARAKAIGALLARAKASDVIDASVVVAAWGNGRIVVTSDPDDLRRLDPSLTLVTI